MTGRSFLLCIICAFLCACGGTRCADRICGVPVHGTPWQLAAAIHDDGDGTFVPAAVDYIGSSKAIIAGWSLTHDRPDTIFCDLKEGKVIAAHLFNEE